MANNTDPYGQSGGTTVITYLQKQTDGVIFFEGFENNNFINADGWTTLQGSPANSSVQAKTGIESWDNNANNGLPVAKKIVNSVSADSSFWLVNVWYYDDAANTTSQGPYLKIKMSDGNYTSIGVRNGISTTKYSYGAIGSSADAPDTASSVTRSTGWHQLQIKNSAGVAIKVLVDGVEIYSVASSTNTVSELYLCSNTIGGTGTSIGYFDCLGYYRSAVITINGNVGTMKVYDSSNVLLSTIGAAQSSFNVSIWGTITYPVSGFVTFSKASPNTTVLYSRSNLLTINPGDVFVLRKIDFGRKITTYDPFVKELQSVNISTAGVRETNNYGLKGDLTFSVSNLDGYGWRQSVDNFFLNSVQGNPFGLMVDNVTDNCFGVIATSSQPNVSTVTILGNLGTTPTSQFANKGTSTQDYYVVQNYANTSKQIVQVTAIGTSTLTFDQSLNFATNPGDYVYSLLYYPFLEVSGNSPTGFRVSDPSIPRYNWVQNCSEWDNG